MQKLFDDGYDPDDGYDFEDADLNGDGLLDETEFDIVTANFAERAKKATKRKNVGGILIIIALTLLSCASSFKIYHKGFEDFSPEGANIAAFLWICIQEGMFIWLLDGLK